MGTETRVGIVAGLVIVVVASVYFFYGSDGGEDELLVATSTRVGDSPKIPAAADQKGGKPAPAPGAGVNGLALKRPASNAQPPGRPADRRAAQPAAPAAGGTGPLVLADPSKTSAAAARPAEGGAIPLRSGPSSELVEATWDNLVKKENKPAGAQGSDLGTVGDRIRTAVAAPSTARPAIPAGTAGPSTATPTPLVLAGADLRRPVVTPATGDPSLEGTGPLARQRGPVRPVGLTGPGDAAAKAPAPGWPKKHVIAEGDTLEVIARDFYDDRTRVKELLAANPRIKSPNQLRIGDELVIPEPTWAGGRGEPVAAAGKTVEIAGPASSAAPTRSSERTYVVRSGDTLYGIAQRQCGSGARWKEILTLNKKLLRGDAKRLAPGMKLVLPD